MSQSLADQLAATALSGGNAAFIEALYEQYLSDPGAVDPAWVAYFKGLQNGAAGDTAHTPIRERLQERLAAPALRGGGGTSESAAASAKQGAVSRLIQIYANRGHLIANWIRSGCRNTPSRTCSSWAISACRMRISIPNSSRQPQRGHRRTRDAQGHPRHPQVHLRRNHRRRIRACVEHRRASLAAGQLSDCAHAAPFRAR